MSQRGLFDQQPDDDQVSAMAAGMVREPAQADTSLAAAHAVKPLTGGARLRVLQLIVGAGVEGVTDEEGIDALAMNPSTYRPRRVELHDGYKGLPGGWICDGGVRRRVRSGQMAVAWVATEKGKTAIAAATEKESLRRPK